MHQLLSYASKMLLVMCQPGEKWENSIQIIFLFHASGRSCLRKWNCVVLGLWSKTAGSGIWPGHENVLPIAFSIWWGVKSVGKELKPQDILNGLMLLCTQEKVKVTSFDIGILPFIHLPIKKKELCQFTVTNHLDLPRTEGFLGTEDFSFRSRQSQTDKTRQANQGGWSS